MPEPPPVMRMVLPVRFMAILLSNRHDNGIAWIPALKSENLDGIQPFSRMLGGTRVPRGVGATTGKISAVAGIGFIDSTFTGLPGYRHSGRHPQHARPGGNYPGKVRRGARLGQRALPPAL